MNQVLERIDPNLLLYGGIFLGVLLAFSGIFSLLRPGEQRVEARNRRMKMIAQGRSQTEILALLKPQIRANGLVRLPIIGDLSTALRQADMGIKIETLLSAMALLSVGLSVLLMTRLPVEVAIPTGVIFGALVPLIYVHIRRKKRIDKLVSQLPDALDLMARSLRVGHPLTVSIDAVSKEMADPIGSEFGLIFDQISYGDELVDAMADFSARLDVEDIHYLSASIAIQHGTGGDLARVITVLSKVVRDRIALRRRIKAISAEGRLTAIFLSCLPILIVVMTSVVNPGYYTGVMDEPLFRPMAIFVIAMTVGNYLILRKLVNFRI